MIFLFLFLGNLSMGAKTYSYHCTLQKLHRSYKLKEFKSISFLNMPVR